MFQKSYAHQRQEPPKDPEPDSTIVASHRARSYVGVSGNEGSTIGDPYNEDCSILGSIPHVPCVRSTAMKLQYCSVASDLIL